MSTRDFIQCHTIKQAAETASRDLAEVVTEEMLIAGLSAHPWGEEYYDLCEVAKIAILYISMRKAAIEPS